MSECARLWGNFRTEMDALRQYNEGGLKVILNDPKVTNDEQVRINTNCVVTCRAERVAVLVSIS